MPPLKTLLIRWRDSSYTTGTFEEAEARDRDLITVQTVGHLVMEHKDRITVAGEYFEVENTYRHLTTIPQVNIEEVIELMPHKGGYPPKKKGKGKKGRK